MTNWIITASPVKKSSLSGMISFQIIRANELTFEQRRYLEPVYWAKSLPEAQRVLQDFLYVKTKAPS